MRVAESLARTHANLLSVAARLYGPRIGRRGGTLLHRRDLLLRLEMGSNPEVLCVVRSAVEQLAAAIGFSAAQSRQVTRAVDEAVANIIRHAYHGQPNRPIAITCYRARHSNHVKGRDCLEIILEDRGAPADRAKLGGRPLDEVRPGGLGMHFIRDGMDAMQYRRMSRKNWLRLMKYLPPANREQSSMKETRP